MAAAKRKSWISQLENSLFWEHLEPPFGTNLITAWEEDIPGLKKPCSAGPEKITEEIGVALHRPAGNFRYGKSHVPDFNKEAEMYWSFTVALLGLWYRICNTCMTSVLRVSAHLCHLLRVSPEPPLRTGGAVLCPRLCRSSENPQDWGGNFGRAGMKPAFHTADEPLCSNYSFSPRTSPWSMKMPCGVRIIE